MQEVIGSIPIFSTSWGTVPDEIHDMLTTKLNFTVNESQEIRYQTARAGSMSPQPMRHAERRKRKVGKGAWRMPWLREATKDVVSCDNRGGGANDP